MIKRVYQRKDDDRIKRIVRYENDLIIEIEEVRETGNVSYEIFPDPGATKFLESLLKLNFKLVKNDDNRKQ